MDTGRAEIQTRANGAAACVEDAEWRGTLQPWTSTAIAHYTTMDPGPDGARAKERASGGHNVL